MTTGKYILDDKGEPIPCEDILTWGRWMQGKNKIVKQEMVGDSKVSTVFLGLDHNFSGRGKPTLWETMIFGGELDQYQTRCSGSREQAEAMHEKAVDKVKQCAVKAK